MDLSVYIASLQTELLLQVLSQKLGTFNFDDNIDQTLIYKNDQTFLVIIPQLQSGFTSIWLKNASFWQSDVELAHYLATMLQTTTRCDPGSAYPEVSPYSDVFLEITGSEEKLVNWN